ncbi:MAG: UDP-N-acetylglucosamine 2-epimerase (non-hydrolyzing) [Bryobacteraceae bacterium]
MQRVLFVFGTRPEAIKLAPVIRRLRESPDHFDCRVAVTGQHRGLLDQVLDVFYIRPDHDLNVMQAGQSLHGLTSRIVSALEPVFEAEKPDWVLVHGDTTTTLCGALAAFYSGIRVGHVEAGLRTFDLQAPFPEEMNRVVVGRLAALHFAPTEGAATNLRAEGIAATNIRVTGNTAIDAVLEIRDGLETGRLRPEGLPPLDSSKKLIAVTGHRRESFGDGFERICKALARLADRDDVEIVYAVHPNPNVTGPVHRILGSRPNVHLIDPLPYVPFVELMRRAHILLTDSGGIQEEAPSLGKPVLVMREKTERPEAVEAGTARLVGTDIERIVQECGLLLENDAEYQRRAHIHNPYGDGLAALRIRAALIQSSCVPAQS